MGSDSKPFDPALACALGAGPIASRPCGESVDPLACIGYEAADPSLMSPHWRETFEGLLARRDWR